MKSAVSLTLIVALSGSTLPMAAQESGDSDWSRACELVAGTEVIVTVQGSGRPRYVLSCDESSLMVLNVSDPAFSADARRVLVEAASNHPDYFVSVQTRHTFILDKNVSLTPDGVFLTEAWTLRAEVEVPRHAGSDIESSGYVSPPSATAPGIRLRTATARRNITIVGLVGHQMLSYGRVRPSFLFGGGFSHLLARESYEVQDRPGSPSWTSVGVPEGLGTNPWTENNPTLTLGLDVEVLMTKTFSLVPRVRASVAMGQTAATILRPGVAARWRF